MFVSKAQVEELTGRKQRPSQIDWLKANRWRYSVDADGTPKIDQAYYERRMIADGVKPTPTAEPDFTVF